MQIGSIAQTLERLEQNFDAFVTMQRTDVAEGRTPVGVAVWQSGEVFEAIPREDDLLPGDSATDIPVPEKPAGRKE